MSDRHVVLGTATLVSDTEIARKAVSEAVNQVFDELLERFKNMRDQGTMPRYGRMATYSNGYDKAMFCAIDEIYKMRREREADDAD